MFGFGFADFLFGGDSRSKLFRLIAMSGSLSEFPVSFRKMVSLKLSIASYSSAFFSFSILISLSNLTSFYNN